MHIVDHMKRGHPAYGRPRVLVDDFENVAVVVCFFEGLIYAHPGLSYVGILSKDRSKLENVFREACGSVFQEGGFVRFAACFSSVIADVRLSLQLRGRRVKQGSTCILFYRDAKMRSRLACPEG